jgi:hypothetical protein
MDYVLGRIYQLDPILAEAIQNGFEDAVDKIRKTAAKSRTRMTSHQVVEALAAVEALRAVLSNRSDNRGHPSVCQRQQVRRRKLPSATLIGGVLVGAPGQQFLQSVDGLLRIPRSFVGVKFSS